IVIGDVQFCHGLSQFIDLYKKSRRLSLSHASNFLNHSSWSEAWFLDSNIDDKTSVGYINEDHQHHDYHQQLSIMAHHQANNNSNVAKSPIHLLNPHQHESVAKEIYELQRQSSIRKRTAELDLSSSMMIGNKHRRTLTQENDRYLQVMGTVPETHNVMVESDPNNHQQYLNTN
ncbi:9517_t:CDS:1, partial [Ambispora gerdemannii]